MKPLNSGPNPEGKLHFDIVSLPVSLPKGSHIDAKITNTADGSGTLNMHYGIKKLILIRYTYGIKTRRGSVSTIITALDNLL